MKTKTNPSKKTVTIVIGPRTEALMLRLIELQREQLPIIEPSTLTNLAGACLNMSLQDFAKTYLNGKEDEIIDHFE